MRQPPLFSDGTNKVWRLKKPLYGLKQASRQRNHKLMSVLIQMGFSQAKHDAALFIDSNDQTLILVWFDDLVIVADCTRTESVVTYILNEFEGRDHGEASWILGLEIVRDHSNRTVTMSQRRMIADILTRFNLAESRPVSTPLYPGQPIASHPHGKAIGQ